MVSGCSAGGLAVYMHCEGVRASLPPGARVKCMGDAGLFVDM